MVDWILHPSNRLCSCLFADICFVEDMDGQMGSTPQSPEWTAGRAGVPSLLLSPVSAGWGWTAGLLWTIFIITASGCRGTYGFFGGVCLA